MKSEELNPLCPICGLRQTFFTAKHTNFPMSSVFCCERCDHFFSYPEPDILNLEQHYLTVYPARRKNFFSPAYFAIMERRADAQVAFILKNGLFPNGNLLRMKCLDLGCGTGALVHAFLIHGAEVLGQDSDSDIRRIARSRYGVNVSDNAIGQFPNDEYDLIAMSHVLEHLPNVRVSREEILNKIKVGGYLFVEVPNTRESIFRKEFEMESHLNFFSLNSLNLFFQTKHTKVVACQACGTPFEESAQTNTGPLLSGIPKLIRIKRLFRRCFARLTPYRIITPYDGFYNYYPRNTDGIWIRCLIRREE